MSAKRCELRREGIHDLKMSLKSMTNLGRYSSTERSEVLMALSCSVFFCLVLIFTVSALTFSLDYPPNIQDSNFTSPLDLRSPAFRECAKIPEERSKN